MKPLRKYDLVLMLYFPRRLKGQTPTPTPGSEDDDDDYENYDEYTPFLVEMNIKEFKVVVYQKKPAREMVEGGFLDKKCKLAFSLINNF